MKREKFAMLTSVIDEHVKVKASPEVLLPLIEEAHTLAIELGLDDETLDEIYEVRAILMHYVAAFEAEDLRRQETFAHNHRVVAEAMREYMYEGGPRA